MRNVSSLVIVILFVGVWELGAQLFNKPFILPSPSQIAVRFWELKDVLLLKHLPFTLLTIVIGLAISISLGVAIAIWMSANSNVRNGIKYVENIRDALKKVDAENAEDYDANAEKYITELKALHEEIIEMMHAIPEEKRILITSEGAFKYFSDAYDFRAAYIWEINSHSEGTPEQLKSIIRIIKDDGVPALFLESSVDPRSMEMVSRETGVPIHGKIFTDSLGKAGSDGDTYIKMIEWNAEMIADGLGK